MDIQKDNQMYMQIAHIAAKRSYAKRLQVGCVIVKNNSIISFGWNGMPTGYDNCCEYEVDGKLVTRPEVQHAELNAVAKLASGNKLKNIAKLNAAANKRFFTCLIASPFLSKKAFSLVETNLFHCKNRKVS